ncbi:MAG: exonuclease SbcCD subunit D [bacterium]|nr:exonuclease SbcCD subunit D [bacterium]
MQLLHFADLHLGIENYGRLDPATGLHSRLLDFRRCLAAIFDDAIERNVDAVLFAGDLYRTPAPNPTWQREFSVQLRRLHKAEIPIVLVVGNHDTPAAFGRATSVDVFNALDLTGTHVVRTPRLFTLPTRSGPLQVAGLPWPTRHYLRTDEAYRQLPQEDLLREISRLCARQIRDFADSLDPALPAILVGHIAASGAVFSGSERTALIGADPTLLTSDLANPCFDYVALGHVHRHQDLNPGGRPAVVYSGSVERVDFGEERETKGFCVISITHAAGERSTTYEFIQTPARPFLTFDVDATGTEDPTTLVLAAITGAELAHAVVRIRYTTDVGQRLDTNVIRQALDEAQAHHVAGITPTIVVKERQRRSSIPQDADTGLALDRYIDNRPELEPHRESLRRYAQKLEQDLAMDDFGGI